MTPKPPAATSADPLAPLLSEALTHEQAGRLAEMERCVRAALAHIPDHPGALFALARLGMRAHRFEAALDLAGQAMVRAPIAPELHRLRGQALANLGRIEDGIAALSKALELAPGWIDAALDLGQILLQAERIPAMLTLLTPLDGPSSAHAEAHALRGRALMVLGRLDEATQAFTRAVAIAPGQSEIIADLASLHIERDQPQAALDLMAPLLAASAPSSRLLYLAGVAQGMLGQDGKAEASIVQVRRMLLAGLKQRGNLPVEVYVQLSRRCNLRCTMCGHGIWKDNTGFMADEVFARVLAECESLGISRMTILAAQGEPFLHPRAFEMMAEAVARGMAVSVVTNGTPFTPERIEKLARLGLETLQFSFAGWDAPSYEGVYVGAKFERTLANLKAIHTALKPTRTALIVKAVAPDNSKDFVGRTRDFLTGIGIERINTVVPNNFAGTVEIGQYWDKAGIWSYRNLDKHRRTVCRILMRAVGIYVDGSVTACGCYDANAALKIGDIMEDGLAALRNGPRFTSILDAFGAGDVSHIPLCAKCDDPFG
ncbi:Fe-S oxidoreductase [Candidatus Terasakiella magnetica]|nr:Fe-S oxidoreductase [Candidatus Terasakiella magnetica]